MQHDQSKITGLRRAERTRSAHTPDRLDVRFLDISTRANSPKRKGHLSRQSTMPPQMNSSTINLRKLELEHNNLESDLVYSQYIASYAELILENKLLKDAEVSFRDSLKQLNEETKLLRENCKLFEIRIRDIKALSSLNDYAEVIQQNINSFKDMIEKCEIKTILSHLVKLLNRFNILRCENITLPEGEEELETLKKILNDCYDVLQQIFDPTQSDTLDTVATEYEEFVRIYNEVLVVKRVVEEEISHLQLEVLKTCSHALSQNDI